MTDLAVHFSLSNDDLATFGIVGLLVGGSNIYSDTLPSASRDWDGLIIVSQRSDIGNLIVATSKLNRMLGLAREESPHFPVSSSLQHSYDAVRYCGFTDSGVKKSVKILSLEHLSALIQSPQPNAIRILSRKNIRVYQATQYGCMSWCLQPAVTLDRQTYLLHDADIYVASLQINCFQYAALGATMDLLVTGKWVYATPAVSHLSIDLMNKLIQVPNLRLPEDWTLFFARGERFGPRFRESLRSRPWASLLNNVPTINFLRLPPYLVFWHPGVFAIEQIILDDERFLCKPQPRYRFLGDLKGSDQNAVCHRDIDTIAIPIPKCGSVVLPTSPHAQNLYVPSMGQFSSNSQSGTILCGSHKLFWKVPTVLHREIAGAHFSAPYGNIHLPLSVDIDNSTLLYPFIDGRSLAEMRLDHLCGFRDDIRVVIIEAEMRRGEDMLAAYCGTARIGFADSSIQQFFCSRLINGSRLSEFYPAGVSINHIKFPLADFLKLPIVINGKSFPPLNTIIESALSILQLTEETTIITGMGDNHSGNVMISKARPMQLTYIDYETAGQHSPWLDFAKPLYNDVFFEALYADLVGRDFKAEGLFNFTISSDEISIMIGDLKFDATARLLWEMKSRLVLKPFTTYLSTKNLPLARHMQILGSALFCCAVFTRNFKDYPDIFLINLALGVLFSQGRIAEVVDLICPNHHNL
ncbi:hypothetical protein C8R43DRAFT_345698 [Mycena crocata]|nr:hypothetical protein C8R43DRAFT_345698 [Mycena crocata]